MDRWEDKRMNRFLPSARFVPLMATTLVLLALFSFAATRYPGFASMRVVANLFRDNAFLGVTAVGMTFVILSGGIDLSVGGVLAFTTILIATLVGQGWHPLAAITLALTLGVLFGSLMGLLIHRYELPPFLVTLGGMFFARGMAFMINAESVGISHDFYDRVLEFGITVGPKARLTVIALLWLTVVLAAVFLAHWTAFGRNVYALGGNEQSALLMGLPVGWTRVAVYALNGFCSALAGTVATFYMGSGNPAMGVALELDAIAAVVIGGTLLTGGSGFVAGTLVGVLILGTIQTVILFDGRLNSWWMRIAIGVLLLAFILLQRLLSRMTGGRR
jgi:ribose/xylose/arabinose/galactoside ABC-type transport system permease subunit